MKKLSIIAFAITCLASLSSFAAICPTQLRPDGGPFDDWDNDQISNDVDNCCFVGSQYKNNSADICPDSATADTNENGIPRGEEGDCCFYSRFSCYKITNTEERGYCEGKMNIVAPCDMAIAYKPWDLQDGGMPQMFPNSCYSTGYPDCICFTIEDYDDDKGGQADNCPTEPNADQKNPDVEDAGPGLVSDLWGNACDPCPNKRWVETTTAPPPLSYPAVPAESRRSCKGPDDTTCDCVLFYLPNPGDYGYPIGYVNWFCSHSPDEDLDEDGVGDLCGDNCTPGNTAAPGVAYNPDQADSDKDGFGNSCDPCPNDPAIGPADRANGWQDSDSDGNDDTLCDNCVGLANPDQLNADGDKFGDLCDNCPEVANDDQADGDSDGYGDLCDGCPEDPEKTEPGLCGCGKPETDTDGDGVPDCTDKCPEDPDKSEPGECGCGKLETDKDEDGVPDCKDNCPDDHNPNQADENGDGIGDACTKVEYTGAFKCSLGETGAPTKGALLGILALSAAAALLLRRRSR